MADVTVLTQFPELDDIMAEWEYDKTENGLITLVAGNYKIKLEGNFTLGEETIIGTVDRIKFVTSGAIDFKITDLSLGTAGFDAFTEGVFQSELELAFDDIFDGKDTFVGGENDDYLRLGASADIAKGNGGGDEIRGGGGADSLFGGDGDDILIGDNGNDRIWGGKNSDELIGDHGRDQMYGGDGADDFSGENGRDEMFGGKGNDFIDGDEANDIISGGKGKDVIVGDEDSDVLTGGRGADTFVFSFNDGDDVVTDFGRGADRLEFTLFTASPGYTSADFVDDYVTKSSGDTTITLSDRSVILEDFTTTKAELAMMIDLNIVGF